MEGCKIHTHYGLCSARGKKLFMVMTQLIINAYVSLMYDLKKLEWYLRVNLLGLGPRFVKKNFTGPRSHKR